MNTDTKLEEDALRAAGWKLHSKNGKRKFWESPHDGKVYSTLFALLAQRVAVNEQAEKNRVAQMVSEATEFDRYFNWDVNLDVEFPPPKKKRKSKKQSKEQNLKELGF